MDSRKYMLLVNGQDKTDSVASFRFQNGMCEVIYTNSPKAYHYRAEKVQLLKVQSRIDPSDLIIMVLRIHAMLHRCLKDAEAAHVIARNPTDGAVVPKANHRPKQKVLIQQMNAERQALRDKMRGIAPPDKLTKTQKKIWTYMKFHPDVTSYRAIARGAGVTRHTAAKWYEMMRGMLGRAA